MPESVKIDSESLSKMLDAVFMSPMNFVDICDVSYREYYEVLGANSDRMKEADFEFAVKIVSGASKLNYSAVLNSTTNTIRFEKDPLLSKGESIIDGEKP